MQAAHAIADPVRQSILVQLRHGPMSAGEIAGRFAISRPAVSRHLRVLREAGLVHDEPSPTDGRGRIYRLDVAPLIELDDWLAPFRGEPTSDGVEARWSSVLDALDTEVHRTKRSSRRATAASTQRPTEKGRTA